MRPPPPRSSSVAAAKATSALGLEPGSHDEVANQHRRRCWGRLGVRRHRIEGGAPRAGMAEGDNQVRRPINGRGMRDHAAVERMDTSTGPPLRQTRVTDRPCAACRLATWPSRPARTRRVSPLRQSVLP